MVPPDTPGEKAPNASGCAGFAVTTTGLGGSSWAFTDTVVTNRNDNVSSLRLNSLFYFCFSSS
jgi:hypothetical protein